jgi:hypothetical protein
MMTLNEIHYNPAAATNLSVVCLVLKSPYTQNMLLRIESTGRYKRKVDECNSKSSRLSYSVFVSLPLVLTPKCGEIIRFDAVNFRKTMRLKSF